MTLTIGWAIVQKQASPKGVPMGQIGDKLFCDGIDAAHAAMKRTAQKYIDQNIMVFGDEWGYYIPSKHISIDLEPIR